MVVVVGNGFEKFEITPTQIFINIKFFRSITMFFGTDNIP